MSIMMIEQSKRNPSLELLRIISMFMIIMLHCLLHGGILKEYSFNDYHYIVIWLIESLCMVSVNVFLLISGYFGYQIGFRLITVVKFYCEVFLYSLVSIGIASFITELSIKEIILSLFPFTSSRYWFATNYILLLLLQPFVNFFIKSLDQLLYKRLIIVLEKGQNSIKI